MLIRVCVLALTLIASAALSGKEWSQFRGPASDGISDANNVPVEWSATEHVAWKQPIPGVGWSSPVLSKGKLYLTTAVEHHKDPIR